MKTVLLLGEFTSSLSMENMLIQIYFRQWNCEKSHTTFIGPNIMDKNISRDMKRC